MTPPRVFISYSHDSAEHKQWVLNFASTIRERGTDVVLDQWDLNPGDDLPHFMETQLEAADFVIMVCTERYVKKANAGEGGVGYEKMIMTSNLLSKIDSSKVIPIIRQRGTDHMPTFLKTKVYINFSNDDDVEYNLDELLRTLLNAPLFKKPEIGKNPFKPIEEARPDRTANGVLEVMKAVAKLYEKNSLDIIYFKDLLAIVSMHRFTLDRYLDEAIEKNFIRRVSATSLSITKNGVAYVTLLGLIDD